MKFLKKILAFLGADVQTENGRYSGIWISYRFVPLNYLLVFFILFCVPSVFYTVDKEENATIRTFGRYMETTGPGLHLKLPWPISVVAKTEITKIKRMEIGFRTIALDPAKYESVPEESEMLTGDENIVDLEFILQYRTTDAYKWQFRVMEPEKLLNQMAQASMRLVIGYTDFDRAITDGRSEIQDKAEKVLQELCDRVDFGVQIVKIQLQDVHPPENVRKAFKDVISAKEDRERLVNEAWGYYNDKIPKAKGNAEQILNQAKGYAAQRVNSAKGDTAMWLQVFEEYKKNPEITRQRLIYEGLKGIMAGSEIIIDSDVHSTFRHLPLDKGLKLEGK